MCYLQRPLEVELEPECFQRQNLTLGNNDPQL